MSKKLSSAQKHILHCMREGLSPWKRNPNRSRTLNSLARMGVVRFDLDQGKWVEVSQP